MDVARWDSLSSSDRKYIHSLCDKIAESGRVPDKTYKRYQSLTSSAGEMAFTIACYETMSFFDVLKILGDKLYCQHRSKDNTVQVKAVISQSRSHPESMIVLEGSIPKYDASIAIKWYQGSEFDITHEIALYTQIDSIDRSALPWFSASYMLWREPVLIVRTRTVLDSTDSERDVGISILKKLKVIHRVCLHCDIKVDNILKDSNDYYLLDFGQSTPIDEKKGDWHTRYVHTKKYMRQGFQNKTSIKTDLVELLHTLRKIQLLREDKEGDDCRKGFSGCLKRYKKVLDTLDEYPSSSVYDKLIASLSK
jgi:hypothetical protein